jgi:hypothetical protein
MITVGFFSNNTFFNHLVQWFTQSTVNHCAIGFLYNGKPSWFQAGVGGVQIVDRGWLSGLVAEYQILPPIDQEVQVAEKKIKEPYAYLTILGFLFIKIAKLFGCHLHNPFYEKSAVVCSEFIVEIDTQHLIHEFDRLDPADISPGDLLAICQSGKSFQKLP